MNVTPIRKDMTGAARARRYRAKKNGSNSNGRVTVDTEVDPASIVTVNTVTVCGLASRVGAGEASRDELLLAERLLMHLVLMSPEESDIKFYP
jgi:hypothetical protein